MKNTTKVVSFRLPIKEYVILLAEAINKKIDLSDLLLIRLFTVKGKNQVEDGTHPQAGVKQISKYDLQLENHVVDLKKLLTDVYNTAMTIPPDDKGDRKIFLTKNGLKRIEDILNKHI